MEQILGMINLSKKKKINYILTFYLFFWFYLILDFMQVENWLLKKIHHNFHELNKKKYFYYF
jgi:hypothetical protein